MKIKKKKISQGAKKDLLVLIFAGGLIKTYFENLEVVKNDENLTKRSNKFYKENKKIDKMLRELLELISSIEESILDKYDADDIRKFMKSKLYHRYGTVMKYISPSTNFELLAIQLIFNNFVDFREKKILEEFEILRDKENFHYEIFDKISNTNLNEIIEQTFKEANSVIFSLKK